MNRRRNANTSRRQRQRRVNGVEGRYDLEHQMKPLTPCGGRADYVKGRHDLDTVLTPSL
jgi:hypothetical protein